VQLCGGAICIEEMLKVTVKTGALWYWGIRKRVEVPIDDTLCSFTLKTIKAVAEFFESGITPKAEYSKKCNSCSLYDDCSPKLLTDNSNHYVDLLLHCDDL
jgi:CRISPR-associated exonuclease Cas4